MRNCNNYTHRYINTQGRKHLDSRKNYEKYIAMENQEQWVEVAPKNETNEDVYGRINIMANRELVLFIYMYVYQ